VVVGIVEDGAIDETPAVESFQRMGMETDTQGCPAQGGKDAADPRKQLAIDDHIESLLPNRDQGQEKTLEKLNKCLVIDGENIPMRNGVQDLQSLFVFLKKENVEGNTWELLLEARIHRVGQDEAAHLGQKDNQDPFRGPSGRKRFVFSTKKGQDTADQFPENPIHSSLGFDIHGLTTYGNRTHGVKSAAPALPFPRPRPPPRRRTRAEDFGEKDAKGQTPPQQSATATTGV
jgi:hypothetical protein